MSEIPRRRESPSREEYYVFCPEISPWHSRHLSRDEDPSRDTLDSSLHQGYLRGTGLPGTSQAFLRTGYEVPLGGTDVETIIVNVEMLPFICERGFTQTRKTKFENKKGFPCFHDY